ncbi:thioesterase family protein [Maricurvus nonylphenolicus]|uniref:thioesterase family protein n=1 Tax=Maricurvus nonylphenolicus TaxID=1008307 RepID=UPI0036F338AC
MTSETSQQLFHIDSAVEKIADNHWRGHIADGWGIMGVPNGGYIMAIAAKALSAALPHKDPLTITAYYMSPTAPGPVDCHIDVLRTGGTTSHGIVRLEQGGELKVHFVAAYTELDNLEGETQILAEHPPVPAYGSCMAFPHLPGLDFMQRVTQRIAPEKMNSMMGKPTDDGEWLGWIEFSEATPLDVFGLLVFADGFPPPVFTLYGPGGWVPTLELTVQLRAKPVEGPIAVRFRSNFLTNGMVEEDGELWDSEGNLVAISRQTAKYRKPK